MQRTVPVDNHMPTKKIKKILNSLIAVTVMAALLNACAGGGDEEDETLPEGEFEGLKVSLTDFRYGVQDVGSFTPQLFKVSNIGVDTYPINDISIAGENTEDFVSELPQGITLEPGDEIEINVAFSPVGNGQRTASLNIDYDTIVGVGSNRVEALYYVARDFEEAGDYVSASEQYRAYLNAGSSTANKARAMIKLPLLEEADVYGAGSDFGLYKTAIDKRDKGDTQDALQLLEALLRQHKNSYLVDDAKYMRAYIQMVDHGDYQTAYDNFQILIDQHPDSTYVDTALYSQGLAQYELGNIEKAEEIFIALKDRHTGIKLGLFELQWPKDNYVSRLWFDKSEDQLEEIQAEEQLDDSQTDDTQVEATADEQPVTTVCEDTPPVGDGWGWDGQNSCRI